MKKLFNNIVAIVLTVTMLIGATPISIVAAQTDTITQYRHREKQYTISETTLSEPWVLHDEITEYEHSNFLKLYLELDEQIDSKYCIHSKTKVYKYVSSTGSSWIYATSSEFTDLLVKNPSLSSYTRSTKMYYRYEYCTKTTSKKTYYYYKWGEWSEWSENPCSTTDDVEVETRELYKINYDTNGGNEIFDTQTKIQNEDIILNTTIPTKDGFTFKGWSTNKDDTVEYSAGDIYSTNASITFYAVWGNDTYTITYNANGGSNAPSIQKKTAHESIYISSDIPTRELFVFKGWSTSQNGEVEYTPGKLYSKNENLVLYAIWELKLDSVTLISSGSCGKNLTWFLTKDGILYISGTGEMYEWSSLSDTPWYSKNLFINKVILEDCVTSIGSYAFAYCPLSEVEMGNGITSIGTSAFNSTELSTVVLGNNVNNIGSYAFGECYNLTSIDLPSTVKSIGSQAFQYCNNLSHVNISDIDSWCSINFADSMANPLRLAKNLYIDEVLATEIQISSNVNNICNYAFVNCKSLESITIPKSVISIGKSAFSSCENLSNVFYTGNKETWNNVTIGEYNVPLLDAAFHFGEESVPEVTITAIEINTLPSKTEYFQGEALDLTGLKINAVYSDGTKAEVTDYTVTGFAPTVIGVQTIIVTYEGNSTTFEVTVINSEIAIIASGTCGINANWKLAKDGLLTISGAGAMMDYTYSTRAPWDEYNSQIKKVIINEGVTSIGEFAFRDFGNLTSVLIADSVTIISDFAFYGCNSLASIIIPDNITTIGIYAFGDCGNLANLSIPNSITTIEQSAFESCSNLTNVEIGNNVTKICDYAFRGCSNLASIKIGSGIITISSWAFDECVSLTDVYYNGTEAEWNNVTVKGGNDELLNASFHFEKEPVIPSIKPTLNVSNLTKGTNAITLDVNLTSPSDIEGKVIVALYDENSLLEVKLYNASEATINATLDCVDGDYIKAFWWDFDTYYPFTDCVKVEL